MWAVEVRVESVADNDELQISEEEEDEHHTGVGCDERIVDVIERVTKLPRKDCPCQLLEVTVQAIRTVCNL